MNTLAIKPRNMEAAPIRATSDDDIGAIKKAMRAYVNYPTLADAIAALNKASAETDDFKGIPVYLQGVTVGEVDGKPAYIADESAEDMYADSHATLAYVAGSARSKEGASIKAVVMFPTPTLDAVLANADAHSWLDKITNKELRHVAFRGYRDADTYAELNAGYESAPTTLEAYLASHARGTAEEIDSDTFDAIWPSYRKHLVKDNPALVKILPAKQEIIKSIRSKSYADAMHSELEAKNVFLALAATIVQIATSQDSPLDASAIKEWAKNRNTVSIAAKVVSDDDLSKVQAFDPSAAAAALGI
jgi:hypothetical protein